MHHARAHQIVAMMIAVGLGTIFEYVCDVGVSTSTYVMHMYTTASTVPFCKVDPETNGPA